MGLDKRTGRPASDITRLKRVAIPANTAFVAPSVIASSVADPCGVRYNRGISPGVFKAEASSLLQYYNLLSSSSGLATSSSINELSGLCGDNEGNVYVADSVVNSVYKYNLSSATLSLVVGTGRVDSPSSLPLEIIPCANAPGTRIWTPSFLQFINGSLYVTVIRTPPGLGAANNGLRVLKITETSIQVINPQISPANLIGLSSVGYDFVGNIFYNITVGTGRINGVYKYTVASNTTQSTTTFTADSGTMYLDSSRNMYFTDFTRIVRISPDASGNISLLGTRTSVVDLSTTSISGNLSSSIVDGRGVVYFSTIIGNNIYTTLSSPPTPLHTSSTRGFLGDGGPVSAANVSVGYEAGGVIYSNTFFAIDGSNNFYFLDFGNNRIRKVSAISGAVSSSSVITTIIGNGTSGNIITSSGGFGR